MLLKGLRCILLSMRDKAARVSIIQSKLHMSALSSALPFPVFTCRCPSGEIFRKPKKGNCLPQSLVRKICVINFDADTGVMG